MSDYTPTPEAVEAAARAIDPSAWRLRDSGTFPLDHPASTSVVIDSQEKATAALTAAGPLIERAVGERVAEGIERLRGSLTDDPDRAALELIIEDAARIAREEANHG